MLDVNCSVGFETLAIRERQIEQHDIHRLSGWSETLERLLQRCGDLYRKRVGRALVERLPNKACIARVVFDQQDPGSLLDHILYWAGSLTISTQNSSIDLTTCRKWSMPTGLVT